MPDATGVIDRGNGDGRRARMTVVVTGGAGFVGSHLVEALLARGDRVIAVDNFVTGRPDNLDGIRGHPRFALVRADVRRPLELGGSVDAVCHLASPASPTDFDRLPREILGAGGPATLELLEFCRAAGARFLLASTSEVYGDPELHPQSEEHLGRVSTTGPRACYDEAKRFAEAAASSYARCFGVEVRIARIFNTYGPRLRSDDGRVVPEFVTRALLGEPLVVHGDGSQTRSFCHVSDLVRGLVALLDSTVGEPVNLGNPAEISMTELARTVLEVTGSSSTIERAPARPEDPVRRRPDIGRAAERLGWRPEVDLRAGLGRTVADLRDRLRSATTVG
jgi:dTDP-glucose 4,6-dehydratase